MRSIRVIVVIALLVAVQFVLDRRDDRRASGDDVPGVPDHAEAPDRLRVATWNVKRLGHGNKRLDKVAQVIARFDVVALQEVMTETVVDALLKALPGWRAAVSVRALGRGTYRERYAVLYRADRVTLDRAFITGDRDDAFAREPYVACLRAGEFDFCLVAVHVIFGSNTRDRDREITTLGARTRRWREDDREKDWIVLGDFNRDPDAACWRRLERAGWRHTTAEAVATSLGKSDYNQAYDHILVDRKHTAELTGGASRVDIVAEVCDGDFARCAREVSDHAPLAVVFRTDGPDDD